MDEISLHNKINTLQSEMLTFHKKLSPVKKQESESDILGSDEDSKFVSICIEIAFGFLKICVCLIGPATFPAVVFCFEGTSPLFWQVTAVSCVITLILALMAATILYAKVGKVARRIRLMFASVRGVFNKRGIFRFIGEIMASDILKRYIHDILYLLFLIFMGSLISFMSCVKNLSLVLYISLMSTGFVSGILSTIIYNLLNNPELIPFHTPRKIEMKVTAPSPEAKRKLNFAPNMTPELRFPAPSSICSKEGSSTFIGTQYTTNLPNIPFHVSQEKGSATLQLPINFSTFFRRLSF